MVYPFFSHLNKLFVLKLYLVYNVARSCGGHADVKAALC